jgi:micrococcal nuclease
VIRLALASVFLVFALIAPASAVDGWRAQDGDSILSPQGERIRLLGVDTPERGCKCQQECAMAEKATAFTRTKLRQAARIELVRFSPDRYGRTLARVYLDGRDLSDMLIEAKLGRPYNGERRLSWC